MSAPDTGRNPALLSWYDSAKQPFPWRATQDPYRILISEVMSQQTQIQRVVERWSRFLERFPTVEDLAVASLADVLEEWSGLGYNRRARSLHECAKRVADTGWPDTVEGLQALPGIGPYTAAAVVSICFSQPTPAIDTNLRRVLSRWHGSPLTDREARAYAEPLIDRDRPGDWNQAVMEIGGSLCTPRDPACHDCPVEEWCADASVYVAPRPQGVFEGSTRQARGTLVRELISGPATIDEISARSGVHPDRLKQASAALMAEGLVTQDNTSLSLAARSERRTEQ